MVIVRGSANFQQVSSCTQQHLCARACLPGHIQVRDLHASGLSVAGFPEAKRSCDAWPFLNRSTCVRVAGCITIRTPYDRSEARTVPGGILHVSRLDRSSDPFCPVRHPWN